jgi:hypothetical protein
MSATIPESMRLDDLLKATRYDCPVDLQGKTFDQATEAEADLEDNKEVTITENGEIGDSLTSDTSLSTMEIANYIKISDSSFGIGKASYNRITEDVPIGGGQKYYVYGGYNSQVGTGDYDVLAITKEPLSVNGGTTEIAYCRQENFSDLVRTDFKELTYEFHLDSSECTFSSVTFTDGSDTLRCSVEVVIESGDPSDVTIIPNFTLN